ncbi:MAG: copA 1 [Devosia sp.]|nr:copA 1 [Devosia sp.]
MDLNDVAYDAVLANDRTLDDQVVRSERNGRVRLRVINGASSTAFWIDLGSADARLVAVDGNPGGRRHPGAWISARLSSTGIVLAIGSSRYLGHGDETRNST